LSYHDLPKGTATFPRREMIDHVMQYHRRFGVLNKPHLRRSREILKENGYTDRDLVDMYSVLQNRPVQQVDEIFAGRALSTQATG
jgi:hypothetical protein